MKEHQCEVSGHHSGEIVTVRPRGKLWGYKYICQGHLYYVCWDYTILIPVVGTERDRTGIAAQILRVPECDL